jgi:hypothetical protein
MALATADVLHKDLANGLEEMKTVEGSLKFVGDRAIAWWRSSDDIARVLNDLNLLQQFGLTTTSVDMSALGLPSDTLRETWQEEAVLASACFRLVLETLVQQGLGWDCNTGRVVLLTWL